MSPNTLSLLPELVLTVTGIVVMMAEPVLAPHSSRKPLGWLAILGTLASAAATAFQSQHLGPNGIIYAFSNTLEISTFSVFFHLLIAAIVLVTLLTSLDYFARTAATDPQQPMPGPGAPPASLTEVQGHAGEYFALVLFASVGMMLMTSAVELLVVFVGLEISSIATYILCGFRKGQVTGAESSIKYFLLGSFATAFFLYGIALAFGATGSTTIATIAAGLATTATPRLAFLAVALIIIGLGFKVSAAPFHVWTPDVYQGAPAPVVGLMSTAPKAAAFAVLLRILFVGFPAYQSRWSVLLWIIAALSMCVGNLGALLQRDVKRMLAYSSIAHAGYLLVAFTALPQDGLAAAMFYTAAYSAMNVGAFAVITSISGYNERTRTLDDYTGLALRQPVLSALLAFFLLSLIGIPFTGGFFGKFYVFTAALRSGHVGLAVIGLLNSGVACFYYLRLLAALYTRPATDPLATPTFGESTVASRFAAQSSSETATEPLGAPSFAPSAKGGTYEPGYTPGTPSIASARGEFNDLHSTTVPPTTTRPVSLPATIGLALAALATLILGILPGHALHLAQHGATAALNDTQHPHPETIPTPITAER